MPYAEVAHVKARAGFIGGAWGESTDVTTADLGHFLISVSDEIDAAIAGLGQSTPAADSVAAKALLGLNADGALLLALDATFPAAEGPQAVTALQEAVRKRYEESWKRLLEGKHPAVTAPEATDTSVLTATDFWTENPEYGQKGVQSEAEPFEPNEFIDPYVTRGEVW